MHSARGEQKKGKKLSGKLEATIAKEVIYLDTPDLASSLGAAEEKSGDGRLQTRPRQGLGSSLDGLPLEKGASIVDLETGESAPGRKAIGLAVDGHGAEAPAVENEQQGAKSQQTWVRKQGSICAI